MLRGKAVLCGTRSWCGGQGSWGSFCEKECSKQSQKDMPHPAQTTSKEHLNFFPSSDRRKVEVSAIQHLKPSEPGLGWNSKCRALFPIFPYFSIFAYFRIPSFPYYHLPPLLSLLQIMLLSPAPLSTSQPFLHLSTLLLSPEPLSPLYECRVRARTEGEEILPP